ncbi:MULTISPECIES: hypothetical protein [Glycomyces]|uniref:Uncharacterized protein n=3 Tax=Glycomyces TaxID=58113 RepID=A0A9X3PJ46_9ACTN|nr:hypothetical protein [Glycomyces lechevalierae]MDA1385782.1 hypothetical protein [Glycomyces lechevalierae]
MALSMFEKERSEARTDATTKTWRALVVGAAVPIAMLAAAPAVSAAETGDQAETVKSEQLPLPDPGLPVPDPGLPVPGGLDPAALADLPDLLTCVSDLLDGLSADVPAPVPAPPVEGSEQLPVPLPVPDPGVPAPGGDAPLPDIADLTTKCQDALANLPAPPVDVPPVEPPVGAPPVAPPVE